MLITIKGKVGAAAVVPEFEGEWNINQDIARVRLVPDVNPYYLVAFVESKLGQLQATCMSTGAINPFLGLNNLSDFLVPIPPRSIQDEIEKTVRRIEESQKEIRTTIEEAKRQIDSITTPSEVAHG